MRHTAYLSALLVAVLLVGMTVAGLAPGLPPEPAAHAATQAANQAPAPYPAAPHPYFIWPNDGTVITGGKFWVRIGLRNMGVAPKGTSVPDTGHHHILVNTGLPPLTEPIPNDRNHVHFGAGETEARIELPPGTHTLQLLLGDTNHVPHRPPVVSTKITITVR